MSKAPNTPTRAQSTTKRKRLIVDSAVECFLLNGFHQTSMRDIAAHAEISVGNLYNHFEGKEALISEIATLETEDLRAIEKKLATPFQDVTAKTLADRVDQFLTQYLEYAAHPETVLLGAEITTEGLRVPDIGVKFIQNRNRLAKALAGLFEIGTRAGHFDQNLQILDTANLVLDLIEGLAVRSVYAGHKPKRAACKALTTLVHKTLAP